MKQINWADHILNFLAVIIGVSLAFYISSYSEQKKEQKEFRQIIQSLTDELSSDRASYIEFQIPSNEEQSTQLEELIGLVVAGDLDSLPDQMSVSFDLNNHSPSTVTFNSISASGKLNLIEDFELRNEVSKFYEEQVKEAQVRGEAQTVFLMDRIMPWMVENTDLLDMDFESMVENKQFVNLLAIYKTLIDSKTQHYKSLVEKSTNLEEKLNEILSEQ